ncbi:MAG: peptidoglycan-binding protein, partial [Candidatus Pacebacteria bacterium]|nr:peptidoglycan-binding protein [Candidatus Paceibacterota bacterium]
TETLNVRTSPSLQGKVAGTHLFKEKGTVVAGPVSSDGHDWYKIDYDSDPDGWSAEKWLEKTPQSSSSPSSSAGSSSSRASSSSAGPWTSFYPAYSSFVRLSGPFYFGQMSDEVKKLQEALARDREIYPEGEITGFYGNKTISAVKRFQKKHGIEPTGLAGPLTREKINQTYGDGSFFPAGASSLSEDRKRELIAGLKEVLRQMLEQLAELLKRKAEGA